MQGECLRFEAHTGTAVLIFCGFNPPVRVVVNTFPVTCVENVGAGWVYVARDFKPKIFVKVPAERTLNRSVCFDYWIAFDESGFSCIGVHDVADVPTEIAKNVPAKLCRPSVGPSMCASIVLMVIDVVWVVIPRVELNAVV